MRHSYNRRLATEHDFKEFCYTYFPNHFYALPSEMHEELFTKVQEAIDNGLPDNLGYAAPRGNAKSTIVSFALPIWVAVFKKKHYIIIVSDTASQADDFLQNIKAEFEENELLIEDFGDLTGLIWTNSDIVLRDGDVRIQALGAGKKIRGRRYKQWRPDLIVCDDLENDEHIMSPDQRKKDETWYTKALSKAGDERTDKVIIGTILHYDSLLTKILKNPIYHTKKYQSVIQWSNSALWDEWERLVTNLDDPSRLKTAYSFFEANKVEMLAGTRVLWPEKENYYSLMLQRVADGPAAFSSEKQNEPLSDEDRRFLPEWFQFYEDGELEGRELFTLGYVDPSLGKAGGDYSAITIIGVDTNYQVYVLDADIDKRKPDVIILDVLGKHAKFKTQRFGVEENQFQEYFKDNAKKAALEQGSDIKIIGVRQHSDKILRIESLQPDIKNGRIKFRRDQQRLIEQLINFPSAAHDDGPDALEGAMSMVGKRSAVADFYRQQADEVTKSEESILQNPSIQNIGRWLPR